MPTTATDEFSDPGHVHRGPDHVIVLPDIVETGQNHVLEPEVGHQGEVEAPDVIGLGLEVDPGLSLGPDQSLGIESIGLVDPGHRKRMV